MRWLQIPVAIASLEIYYLLVPLAIKILYFSYAPKWLAGYFNAFELLAEAVIFKIVPIEYVFSVIPFIISRFLWCRFWINTNTIYIFSVALRPNAGHGLPILEVSRSHTTTHHSRQDSSGQVISSSPRPLPNNTQHSQQTNIHAPVGFEPTISAGERPLTYALDRAGTGTGTNNTYFHKYESVCSSA